jgi:hypothetical protein
MTAAGPIPGRERDRQRKRIRERVATGAELPGTSLPSLITRGSAIRRAGRLLQDNSRPQHQARPFVLVRGYSLLSRWERTCSTSMASRQTPSTSSWCIM